MSRSDWGPSSYACPDCGHRLQQRGGPDGMGAFRCQYCEWEEVYDPGAHEFPTDDLDRYGGEWS